MAKIDTKDLFDKEDSNTLLDQDYNSTFIKGSEAIPPADFLKWLIIKKLEDAFNAYDAHYYTNILRKRKNKKVEIDFISKVSILFNSIRSSLKEYDRSLYNNIRDLLFKTNGADAETALSLMEDFLYIKKVTKFDSKIKIEEESVEARNKLYGI
jgi:hypothetical protein